MSTRKYWEFQCVVTQRQLVDTPADATEAEARSLLGLGDWEDVGDYERSDLIDSWEEEDDE